MKFLEKHHWKILIIFYIIYASYFLPVIRCGNTPITIFDYSWHYADMLTTTHFLKTDYRMWGYDPYHFAGFANGALLAADNHWTAIFGTALGDLLGKGFAFNISVIASYLLLPLLAYLSARNFKLDKTQSLIFSATCMFLITGFYWFYFLTRAGLYAFILSVFLSLYTSSLLYKYLHEKTHKNWIKMTLAGAFTFFVHPLTAIMCAFICIPLLITHFKKLEPKDALKFSISAAFIIIVNLGWLMPLIEFSGHIGTRRFLQTDYKFRTAVFQNISFLILLGLFLYSTCSSYRKNSLATSSIISAAIISAITFAGSQLGMTNIEPARFIILLAVFCSMLTAKALTEQIKQKHALYALTFIVLLLTLIRPPEKLGCGHPKEMDELVQFIKANTTNDRIHAREDERLLTFNSHPTSYLPHATGKQFLSGPYKYEPDSRHQFTQFLGDYVFLKNITTMQKKELHEYLELYNVKYFLILNKDNKFFKQPAFKELYSKNQLYIYEYLNASNSYCHQCEADVNADYDLIEVRNAASPVTTLKYHYISTLKTKPELKIEPTWLMDDPVPFIKVHNGNTTSFTVYN